MELLATNWVREPFYNFKSNSASKIISSGYKDRINLFFCHKICNLGINGGCSHWVLHTGWQCHWLMVDTRGWGCSLGHLHWSEGGRGGGLACTYNMVISSLSLLGHHRPQLLVTIVTSETTRFTFTWRDPCLGDLLNALQVYCKNQPKKVYRALSGPGLFA